MKTEFKRDVNGLYLEVAPGSSQEALLLKMVMDAGIGYKISIHDAGNGNMRVQPKKYLKDFGFDPRIMIEIKEGGEFSLARIKGTNRVYAVLYGPNMSYQSGPVKIYRLKEWQGNNEAPVIAGNMWVCSDASGPVDYLGYCETEAEVLAALGI
ncbi:MAG: hypothetical protein RBS07_07825 [Lentimicrobium sp.]|jgi:hypothetical protein|nr:hypothetical protein [Lentimicrobium sp.]